MRAPKPIVTNTLAPVSGKLSPTETGGVVAGALLGVAGELVLGTALLVALGTLLVGEAEPGAVVDGVDGGKVVGLVGPGAVIVGVGLVVVGEPLGGFGLCVLPGTVTLGVTGGVVTGVVGSQSQSRMIPLLFLTGVQFGFCSPAWAGPASVKEPIRAPSVQPAAMLSRILRFIC